MNGQKSEIIATNVSGTLANDELSEDLYEITFCTVSVKAAKRKLVKVTPIKAYVVRRTLSQG
jgi:hypothetical protein